MIDGLVSKKRPRSDSWAFFMVVFLQKRAKSIHFSKIWHVYVGFFSKYKGD